MDSRSLRAFLVIGFSVLLGVTLASSSPRISPQANLLAAGTVNTNQTTTTPTSTPSVNPQPKTGYTCDYVNYTCAASSKGEFANQEDCLEKCVAPPVVTTPKKYACQNPDTKTCVEDSNGKYGSSEVCAKECIPPPTPVKKYTCKDQNTKSCIEDINGKFASLSSCQSECKPKPVVESPVVTVRYACQDPETSQCVEDKNGSFETKDACLKNCQPSRYSCNKETFACEKNAAGAYGNKESCAKECVAPTNIDNKTDTSDGTISDKVQQIIEDKFNDKEEIQPDASSTQTGSNRYDTDGDGLSDEAEKNTGTDSLNPDTDGDSLLDGVDPHPLQAEVRETIATNLDTNGNGVPDTTEQQYQEHYGITIRDGETDTDRDGMSDALEMYHGTNPTRADSDGDGLTDGQEISEENTDPNDSEDRESDDTILLSSLHSGIRTSTHRIPFMGVAQANDEVEIFAIDARGNSLFLCRTKTTENRRFLCISKRKLKRGHYMIIVKSLKTDDVSRDVLIQVEEDETLPVKTPTPKKINDVELPEELTNLEDIIFTVVQTAENPFITVRGITSLGTRVFANWTSVLYTSALIANAAGGEFTIQSPEELEKGEHKVVLYARRPEDNVVSSAVQINFKVTDQGEITDVAVQETSGAENARAAASEESSGLPVIPFAVGLVVLLAIGGIVRVLRKG